MGWKEGEGVGRNAKSGRADPVEFVPRMGRLGLGADTMDVPGATLRKNSNNNDKKIRKPGETRRGKDGDISERSKRVSSAWDEERKIYRRKARKEGRVRGERREAHVRGKRGHEGLTGRVLKIQKADRKAQFELDSSGEVITFAMLELDEMVNAPDSQRDNKRRAATMRVVRRVRRRGRKKNRKKRMMMMMMIRGSIHPFAFESSKSFSGGIYYLKKGTIVDIPTPKECTVQIDGDNGRTSPLVSGSCVNLI